MEQAKIEKWVYGGAGLARTEEGVVLAPFALPGETVKLGPRKRRAGVGEAPVEEILEKSPDRIEPRCPLFARCGGCHYQMAPYEYQLQAKAEILREVLARVGRISAPERISVISGEPWG